LKDEIKAKQETLASKVKHVKDQVADDMQGLTRSFEAKFAKLEQLVRDSEKKTLGKISDCDSLLAKRASIELLE